MQPNILVFEDEPMAAATVQRNLRKHGYEHVTTCSTLAAAVGAIGSERFDLALLDIHSEEDENAGIKLANVLRRQGDVQLIFMTAHRGYGERAIASKPRSILIKPFNPSNLLNAVALAVQELESRRRETVTTGQTEDLVVDKDKMFVRNRTTYHGVPYREVLYVAADNGTINIVSLHEDLTISSSLRNFEEQVRRPTFVRIDKRYIINIQQITRFSTEEVTLASGKKFALSKTAYANIKSRLKILKSK